jgi:hypothetical protein
MHAGMSASELVQMLRSKARKSGSQTSTFRGVSLLKQTGKWHAQINVNGKQVRGQASCSSRLCPLVPLRPGLPCLNCAST